jgi:hypothetical protein
MRDPRGTDPMATRMMDVRLAVNGSFSQDTDFSGNGTESGVGDDHGRLHGHGACRTCRSATPPAAPGSYFSASRAPDPIEQEMCAPNNLLVNYRFPDWTCEPGGCPMPAAPLVDTDGDGVFDEYDNCPMVANPTQANADFDREGDACDSATSMTDTDRDGVPDAGDNCPMAANPMQQDTDRDGMGDACDTVRRPRHRPRRHRRRRDNCVMVANPMQEDADMDGRATPATRPPRA